MNHNFEETHRAWGQRTVETLPPTQRCLAGHTVLVSVTEESREVRGERGQRVQRSLKKEKVEVKNEVRRRRREGNLPQPSIHSSCSSRDNLGDEDPWIIRNVGIVYSSSDAKAQARVPLHIGYDWHFQ